MRVGVHSVVCSSGRSDECGQRYLALRGVRRLTQLRRRNHAGVIRDQASFYWHLGDLRAIFEFDEDMQPVAEIKKNPYNVLSYESAAWDDFIQNQIAPFKETPFFLGIGNHEMIPPKNREQFIQQFADRLDRPAPRDHRLADRSH
jgi:hypothetical protein